MKFYGLKKVTLIDYPDIIACTVFTHGCTLRCPFCHNPELVIDKPDDTSYISDEELLKFLENRVNKLDGVVCSGGEPLLHVENLVPTLNKIKALGFKIKIDTNGTLPKALGKLIKQDLVDYIAMDFKTSYEKYSTMGATPDQTEAVKESLQMITSSKIPYEIRTTVVPGLHTTDIIKAMGPTIRKLDRYVIQNFVPNGTIDSSFKKTKPFSPKEMKTYLSTARKFNKKTELRDQQS